MIDRKFPVRPIGGYMELQLEHRQAYYQDLIPLNTGRNALEYILRIRRYTLIYLPYFTCEVLLEPLQKLGIEYKFYKIDEDLNPIIDFELEEHGCMLYTNYFGVKTGTVKWLSKTIKHLIIDNAQAFYTLPIHQVDTFYSCRKFFGVPDGAYLYASTEIGLHLKVDHSVLRFSHLIRSIDFNIEDGYADYLKNNQQLSNNEIKTMSVLTSNLLAAIDYEHCAKARKDNFNYLHKYLRNINMLRLNFVDEEVPMVYPLLLVSPKLKEKLIAHKIFVATYWPNVFDWTNASSYEYFLSENLIALPIDHRYTLNDMRCILTILNSLL